MLRAFVERHHAVLLRRGVGTVEVPVRLCQREIGNGLVAGDPCGMCPAELANEDVDVGQHDLELLLIERWRGLATSLVGELGEPLGPYLRLSRRVDPMQLPVDFPAESNELPNERILDRDLLGRGRATTPRDPDR